MEKLMEHKHCPICQGVMPKEDDFCSDECRKSYEGMAKKRKRSMWIFYAIMALMFVWLIYSMTAKPA